MEIGFPDYALSQLRTSTTDCTDCPNLGKHCPGAGNPTADLMLIGEAPGEREVQLNTPFAGRAGGKLNDLLYRAGIDRADIYITNTVHCRPPDNRDPSAEEIANCRPYLWREIRIVHPKIVVTLGRVATSALLERNVSIGEVHGQLHFYQGKNGIFHLIPTYHPASLLYSNKYADAIHSDWQTITEELKR